MSERKEKSEYLAIILRELSKTGYANVETLMSACELEIRQLKTYIAILHKDNNDWGVHVEYNRKKNAYQILQKGNLVNLLLTPQEIASLKAATKTLEQFADLPIFQDLKGLFEKLDQAVYFRTKAETQEVIEFESVPLIEGLQFLKKCWQAIQEKQVIEITYQKFGSLQSETRTLHPYLLKEHRNRWYIIGLDHQKQVLRMFGLERIKIISPAFGIKYESNQSNLKRLFSYSFGIFFTYTQKPEQVILCFTPKRAEYLKTQPFHPQQLEAQRIMQDDTLGFKVRFDLIINDELVMELARLGADVEVISPLTLRGTVRDYLKEAYRQYPENLLWE